jgi:hypothetical protein
MFTPNSMKRIFLALLLLPFFASAQQTDTIPFNGATKIIIGNNLKAVDGLKLVIGALTDNGFNVDVANTELGILRTEQKQVNAFGLQIIDVHSKDNQIILTTRLRVTILDGTEFGKGNPKEFTNAPYSNRKFVKSSYQNLANIAKSIRLPFIYSN